MRSISARTSNAAGKHEDESNGHGIPSRGDPGKALASWRSGRSRIDAKDVNIYYGDKHAIKNLSIAIPDRAVSAFIGPSGCGKSTFLRAINRMNDTIPSCRMTGDIRLDGDEHL